MAWKSWLTTFLILVWTLRVATSRSTDDLQGDLREYIQEKCGSAKYPSHCIETLLGLGETLKHQKPDILFSLVEKMIDETIPLTSPHLSNQSYQVESLKGSQHAVHASIDYCTQLMKMSLKRLDQSLVALQDSPTKRKDDIQTWLSAVLTFQHTCKDSINGLSSSFLVDEIYRKMDDLSRMASNSLSLINRIREEPKAAGASDLDGRRTQETNSFPSWVSNKNRRLLQTPPGTTIKANAVVAKDGTGNYETVSEAINAASGGRFVIHVKSGVYKEKIHTNKDGITLIGDGKYSTIITNDDSVGGGSSMPGSATFAIMGDGFIAKDIGFQNTAGPQGKQALAIKISSDHSVLYRCSIQGYQDTLYALALRQFYRECDIYGTIDFIFGNAAAVFQSCNIVLRRPHSGGSNAILANGREDEHQNTGFSVQRCSITASPELASVKHSVESYLGRPWKKYSRAVVMQSTIDDVIRPRGWSEWTGSFALSTLYFAEYQNSGPGAETSQRVKWSGYHIIGPGDAAKYTVGNFIGGTSWLPSTGVNFDSGLA